MSIIKSKLKKIGAFFGRNWPIPWMKFRYFVRFRKNLDLINPKNLNEKILYLSLKTDTSSWTPLSDKYEVRKYVRDKIGDDKLVKLYGKWEDANEIEFSNLPDSFVLKTNHGSGEIKIVKDKSLLNIPKIIKYFNQEIKRPYGEIEAGKHYYGIKPFIIAEELLVNDDETSKFSESIIDYKCWCFNGKCEYIWTAANRSKSGAEVMLYDKEWNSYPEYCVYTSHYRKGEILPKPKVLNKLIQTAEKLADDFPCVRVDLYIIGDKIYFGEMTFTSLGGMMNDYSSEFLLKAGQMIDLSGN